MIFGEGICGFRLAVVHAAPNLFFSFVPPAHRLDERILHGRRIAQQGPGVLVLIGAAAKLNANMERGRMVLRVLIQFEISVLAFFARFTAAMHALTCGSFCQ